MNYSSLQLIYFWNSEVFIRIKLYSSQDKTWFVLQNLLNILSISSLDRLTKSGGARTKSKLSCLTHLRLLIPDNAISGSLTVHQALKYAGTELTFAFDMKRTLFAVIISWYPAVIVSRYSKIVCKTTAMCTWSHRKRNVGLWVQIRT